MMVVGKELMPMEWQQSDNELNVKDDKRTRRKASSRKKRG